MKFIISLMVCTILAKTAFTQQLGPYVEILRNNRDTINHVWKIDEILPFNYNNLMPPTVNNTPVVIEVGLSVLSFRSIKENSLSFSVDVFFHQYWNDWRLRLPAGLDPKTKLRLNKLWKDRLWTPDTYFRNAIEGSVTNIIDPILYLTIENQTKVFMAVKLNLEFSCDMDFTKYPFDSQSCALELSSLSNSIEMITYKWKKFQITKNIYLPHFEISKLNFQTCVKKYEDIGTFSCLRANLTLKRNIGNFIIKRYIPSFLIVILTFLGFWIPTTAYPARVALTITALLSLIAQQSQEDLNVSYIYAMNVWMFMCILFVFGTLIEFAFAISLPQKTDIDNSYSSEHNSYGSDHKASNGLKKIIKMFVKSNSRNNSIDMFARIVFPILFFSFIIIYTIVYVY